MEARMEVIGDESESGQHRRQARNPACSAAVREGKNTTLQRRGSRAGQTGRQNILVDVTP